MMPSLIMQVQDALETPESILSAESSPVVLDGKPKVERNSS